MPGVKKKIALIADSISFTNYCIIYKVSLDGIIDFDEKISGVVVCNSNIKDKDLILNPCYLDKENREVIFTPCNPTPHFYQNIINKSLKDIEEYKDDIDNIYRIGDVVGYLIKTPN